MRYRWRLPVFRWEALEQSSGSTGTVQASSGAALGELDTPEYRDWSQGVCGLSEAINVPKSIASILTAREIRTFEEAREYFRPSLERTIDPYQLTDMEKAVQRIKQAITNSECITIYGDYDVDGTTSTAMLTLFLRSLGARTGFHIPDRFTEGYGLSTAGIDRCLNAEGKPDLIITIDCGVTAIEAVAYARAQGVDVIICDHHEPADTLPDANAILNPMRRDCGYPFKSLCGCGVGFKLVQALAREFGVEDTVEDYLDFVALASSADIVSLKGENRILTHFGLKRINENPRPGIKALIDSASIKPGKIGTSQLVFGMAPRINAAGRLGDGGRSVRLLMAQTQQEAIELASELELVNASRRRIDEEAFFEACEMVDLQLNRVEDKIIVLHHPDWHAGVIGIVASRLVERYHLPVVLLTTIDGVAKGSARSISGFDIHSALKRCEDKLLTFGGHKYAAGVSIHTQHLPEFREAINKVAKEMISEDMLQAEIRIDACMDLNELNPKFFAIIRQFSPFGPDNARPVFHTKNVEVVGSPRIVGKAVSHLKFYVRNVTPPMWHAGINVSPNLIPFTLGGATLEAMGFGLGERIQELLDKNGRPRKDLELVFMIDENEYNGRVTPQLVVKDFR